MFKNKRLLVTGGTGSFGKSFIPMTLSQHDVKEIIVFSRDEIKQWEMSLQFKHDPRLKFVIGDVRDTSRLSESLEGVDFLIHAAATKIVPSAEYNPSECIKTNINGAMNVIQACKMANVRKVVALSTDKASNPINLYGATKLASDKLFCASNSNSEVAQTKFSVVRYGNVMGSRGSVIPFFQSLKETGELPITHPDMTRFMISLDEAVKLVWTAFEDMLGGEIYVKKIPSMKILDIARAVAPKAKCRIIGIRAGEKLHEQMIGEEDAPHTYEYDGYYKILPAINNWSSDPKRIKGGLKVPDDFFYRSDSNNEWMSASDLEAWIAAQT